MVTKTLPVLTQGAIMDFLDVLPEQALRDKVEKAIRDYYRNDYPGIPTATPGRRNARRAKKR